MVREELYITVPNLFRCPISMDVMRSPVSLCTGVTYDRSSIQHWLNSGHDTCPATMQTLSSKDFVPNLTLRRLINLWAQSNGPPSPSPSLPDHRVRSLLSDIHNGKECILLRDNLSEVAVIAAAGEENRRVFAASEGFVPAIVGALSRGGGGGGSDAAMEVVESAVRVLNLFLNDNGVREKLNSAISRRNYDFLPSICSVIQKGKNNSAKIESVRVLESVAVSAESKRAIAENQDLLHAVLGLLTSENDSGEDLNDAVFSCLIAISATHSAKAELVRSGLVELVAKKLSDPSVKTSTKEKGLKLMSMMSTCAEGRSSMRESPECAKAVAERLMKVSRAANEEAVAVLWNLCCLLGDKRAQEAVVRSNGVAKVLLVMQSGYCEGHRVRKMCADLVKVLSAGCRRTTAAAGSGSGLCLGLGLYESKTTHIMPC